MLRIFVLLIALGAGGLCGWLLLSAKPAPQAVAAPAPEIKTVDVLVASADLAMGQVLSEKDLRWHPWPAEAVSAAYISRSSKPDAPGTLKGSMVRVRFVAGEPIQEEKLSRLQAGMLATMLPAGKRAVAIRVSAESTAGGFIVPNDRVDVIRTVTRPGSKGEPTSTGTTILSNIRVLAIDQKADEAKDQAVYVGKTATLELDAEQAEIITASQAMGSLSLALRSFADSGAPVTMKPVFEAAVQVFHGERSATVRFQ
jgi:pilus assembly protein CpaB